MVLGRDTVNILISAVDATAAAFTSAKGRIAALNAAALRVRSTFSKLVKTMALVGTAAALGGAVIATKTYMEFEQALANTASVASATAEELKLLENAAREMGKTTAFSASQAANAMYFLGSAGYDTTQIINSLNGVMLLAGATQSDLAYTSESVVATLNMFNMNASESTRVSNVYAAAIANSQATMEKLTDSMRYIGPVANALGWTFEETTASLGALYNMGFRGEQAGTILRGAIVKTIIPTTEATEILKKYGLTMKDIDPTVLSLSEQMDVLRDANLSVAETLAIFQQRAGPGMLAIINGDKEAISKLEEKITDMDAATKMYNTQLDTLKGTLTILKSALEEVGIVIGGKLSPHIREAANNFKASIPTIMEYLSKLKNELAPTLTNLRSIIQSLKGIVKDLFGTDAKDEISDFAELMNRATEYAKKFFDMLDRNPALVKMVIAVGAVTVAFSYLLPAIIAVGQALPLLSVGLAAISANPLIIAIAGLVAGLILLEAEFGTVSKAAHDLKPALVSLKEGFWDLGEAIQKARVDFLSQEWVQATITFLEAEGILNKLNDTVKETGDASEETGSQIELTKDSLENFLTTIEASTPAIQNYKTAVENTATAMITWERAQTALQEAQLALKGPLTTLTKLNSLVTENIGLEQELSGIVAESKAIWEEAAAAEKTALETVAGLEEQLIGLVDDRAQANEDYDAKIARIAQNEINAKEAIKRTNESLLISQYALISSLETYDDLTRSLAGAELSVEGAEIAVEKAQAAYDKIGKAWTPIEIGFSFPGAGSSMDPFAERDAALALKNANLALVEAIDRRADTQERLNALKGAEEIENVIAAYKGISAEDFKTELYVGGQLDIEALKESITDTDAAAISERIKMLLPDLDLGTGIDSIISAISSYEDDVLTLEQKLTGYTQDRLEVTEDLHDEIESLLKDEIEWTGDLEEAKKDVETATKNVTIAEREWDIMSEHYARKSITADNDRLTRAGILYGTITENETDYNALLEATGGTYSDLETSVENLQSVVDKAQTANQTAQINYNTELGKTKKLLEIDMVAAWGKLTKYSDTVPANATINLPDIEDLLKPFFTDIQKLPDDNPLKIAVGWQEGSPFWEDGFKTDYNAIQKHMDDNPLKMTVIAAIQKATDMTDAMYNAWVLSLIAGGMPGAGLLPIAETPPATGTGSPTEKPQKRNPQYTAWKEIRNAWSDLPDYDMTNPDPYNDAYADIMTLMEDYKSDYDEDYHKHNQPYHFLHSGGEILRPGQFQINAGEWVFPEQIVDKLRALITLPIVNNTANASTVTINMPITIEKEVDADTVIAKITHALNRRALL